MRLVKGVRWWRRWRFTMSRGIDEGRHIRHPERRSQLVQWIGRIEDFGVALLPFPESDPQHGICRRSCTPTPGFERHER